MAHRGRGMFLEEKRIGKIKDSMIFKKFLKFLIPYKKLFVLTIFLLAISTFFDLAMPYIYKKAIDEDLMPGARELIKQDTLIYEFKAHHKNWFIGNYIIQGRIPKHIRSDLERNGYIGKTKFYYAPLKQIKQELLRKYKRYFIIVDGYALLNKAFINSMKRLDIISYRESALHNLFVISIVYLSFLILNFIVTFGQVYVLQYIGQSVMFDMRTTIFKKVMSLPVDFFDKNPVGRIVTRATNDVAAINEFFTSVLVYLFKDLLLLAGILVIMFKLSHRLTYIMLILVPIVIGISALFQKFARMAYREVRRKLAKLNAYTQETLSAMEVIKVFNAMKRMVREYRKINHELYDANMKQLYTFALFRPLIEMLRIVALALIFYYGSKGIIANVISFGTFVAFLSYIDMFFSPIRDLAEKYNVMQSAFAAGERIFILLDEKEEANTGKIEKQIEGNVGFKDVWFGYNANDWILKRLDFEALKDESLAIVGPTGAGKTSTISLIARFYKNQRGTINIDGINIDDYNIEFLRKQMAFVFQDVFIFSGSVKKNIALWDNISDSRINKALELVYAIDFVNKLPDGINTPLGERGVSLSMGQRQLLSFARAIVRNPSVLVLDEATSNIDSYTEDLIKKALKNLMKSRTSIVIAHRLSTIKDAHNILVIMDGEIKERGTHNQLIEQNGIYAKLQKIQFNTDGMEK